MPGWSLGVSDFEVVEVVVEVVAVLVAGCATTATAAGVLLALGLSFEVEGIVLPVAEERAVLVGGASVAAWSPLSLAACFLIDRVTLLPVADTGTIFFTTAVAMTFTASPF